MAEAGSGKEELVVVEIVHSRETDGLQQALHNSDCDNLLRNRRPASGTLQNFRIRERETESLESPENAFHMSHSLFCSFSRETKEGGGDPGSSTQFFSLFLCFFVFHKKKNCVVRIVRKN